jgi:CRISPR-associated protein Cas1
MILKDQERLPRGPEEHALLPVRMVTQYAYCPRLFFLMHVEGQWAANEHTEDGKRTHRRIDRFQDPLPDPPAPEEAAAEGEENPPKVARSVDLGSEALGLVGKLDLVSVAGDEALPVETKRGKPPDNPLSSWEPERVQVMAQALLLREHGYRCDRGILYYAAARRRVEVRSLPSSRSAPSP